MMSIIGRDLSDIPGLSASLGFILVLTSLFATKSVSSGNTLGSLLP